MAAKKKATTPTVTRTRVVVAKPAPRRRKTKKSDKVDTLIAGGVGWISPDVLAVIPGLGPWLQRNPQIPPAIVAAALAFVGGRLAGGQWREAGKYAALGALAQYVLRRAGSPGASETTTQGIGGADVIDARQLFDMIQRELPAASPPAEQGVARVRRIGELSGAR